MNNSRVTRILLIAIFILNTCLIFSQQYKDPEITQIGQHVKDVPDMSGVYGHIIADENGDVWYASNYKDTIIHYSQKNGFIREFKIKALSLLQYQGSSYCIEKKEENLLNLYMLDPVKGPVLNKILQNDSWTAGYRFGNSSLNSKYWMTVSNGFRGDKVYYIFKSSLADGSSSKTRLDIMERNLVVSAADEETIYILAVPDEENPLPAVFRFRISDGKLMQSFDLPFDGAYIHFTGADTMHLAGGRLYVSSIAEEYIIKLDNSGKMMETTKSYFLNRNPDIYKEAHAIVGNELIAMGRYKGKEALLLFKNWTPGDYLNEDFEILFQPEIPNDLLYSVYGIAADNEKLYICCSKEIKVFINGKYSESIQLPQEHGMTSMAVNSEGFLAYTLSYTGIGTILNGSVSTVKYSRNQATDCLYGIAPYADNRFIIRNLASDNENIVLFDPKTGKMNQLLVNREYTETRSPYIEGMSVVADSSGNIYFDLLGKVIKMDNSGKKIDEVKVSEYEKAFWAMEYIPKTGDLAVATDYGLLFIDTNSLEIIYRLNLTEKGWGTITDITSPESGIIYIKTNSGFVYKLDFGF